MTIAERIRTLIPLNNKYYRGPQLGTATRKRNETLEKTVLRADDSM